MGDTKGVTLPELLIAVVLIVLLLALTLPALQQWRQHSVAVRCSHNLQQVGTALFAYSADHQNSIPTAYNDLAPGDHPNQTWATRLLLKGYIGQADALFCPGFLPRNNDEATRSPWANGAVQSYGLRRWVPPGTLWLNEAISGGSHRLSTIIEPSKFFLVADSYWTPENWRSQGYSITPGAREHRVHIRHKGRANALFADGHVESLDAGYFQALSSSNTEVGQRIYTGGREKEIFTIDITDTN